MDKYKYKGLKTDINESRPSFLRIPIFQSSTEMRFIYFLTKESKLYNVVALAFEKNKLSQQKLKSLKSRYSCVLQDSL